MEKPNLITTRVFEGPIADATDSASVLKSHTRRVVRRVTRPATKANPSKIEESVCKCDYDLMLMLSNSGGDEARCNLGEGRDGRSGAEGKDTATLRFDNVALLGLEPFSVPDLLALLVNLLDSLISQDAQPSLGPCQL